MDIKERDREKDNRFHYPRRHRYVQLWYVTDKQLRYYVADQAAICSRG